MPKEKEHSLYAAAAAGDPDFINKIPADLYKKAAGQADPHAPLNQGSELFYAEDDMPEADPELIQDVEQMLKDIACEDEPQVKTASAARTAAQRKKQPAEPEIRIVDAAEQKAAQAQDKAAAAPEKAEKKDSSREYPWPELPAHLPDFSAVPFGQGLPQALPPSFEAEHSQKQIKAGKRVLSYLGAQGRIAAKLPGYRERTGQLNLAQAVLEALDHSQLLLAEAGTGTGKTYAYLVPVLLNGLRAVISTGSKALQDQLVQHDIPRLLKLTGHTDVTFMGLKGFNNYLCLRRFREALRGHELRPLQEDRVQRFINREIQAIQNNPASASFGDVNAALPPDLASKLVIPRKRCLNEKCECYRDCFVMKAREQAAQCRIVVINHALLFASLGARSLLKADGSTVNLQKLSLTEIQQLGQSGQVKEHCSFLPQYRALICDEAHMLPDFGRTYYAKVFDSRELIDTCRELQRELNNAKFTGRRAFETPCTDILHALAKAQGFLAAHEGRCNFLALKYINYSPDLNRQDLQLHQEFRDLMADVYLKIRDLLQLLVANKEQAPNLIGPFITDLKEQQDILVRAMNCDVPDQQDFKDDNHVCCADISARHFAFSLEPIDIGPYFVKDLAFMLACRTGVVMASATLSVRGSFDKFSYDIGAAPLKPQTFIVGSTFNYAQQACLYLSPAFPDVGAQRRNAVILHALYPLMDLVPGGIFYLTTSYRSLHESAEVLQELFKGRRRVLVQSAGKSNAVIMQEFKDDGAAVLVGTSSFWAGVDVPGQALSLVIIDKLPFASPADPFEQARSDKLKRSGGNPFVQIALPEAIIALRQGVGRLIRTEQDKGGLIICDPRIFQAGYGRRVVEALPPMHRCASLNELRDFLVTLY